MINNTEEYDANLYDSKNISTAFTLVYISEV